MSIRSITYVSTAAVDFTEDRLEALLERSRINNAHRDITGLLLFSSGSFMQIIEGPEQEVAKVFDRIGRDHDHHGIVKLFDHVADERSFPDWTMAFRSVKPRREGFSAFLESSILDGEFLSSGDPAKALLVKFRDRLSEKPESARAFEGRS